MLRRVSKNSSILRTVRAKNRPVPPCYHSGPIRTHDAGDPSMTRPEAVEGSDNSRFYLETWGAFFESRREPLIRWIMRRRSIQRHDAEDAYQDTVLKMLKKVQHLDGWNESGLHTFMMTTLFRSAVDQWRRDSRLG